MSRIISPETPAVVATQLMTSRSWQSRAKARRTCSSGRAPACRLPSSSGTVQRRRARQQDRFFCPRQLERLLEDLDLHGLTAEQPFEVAHPLLEPAQLGGGHNLIIGAYGFATPFAHQPPPAEYQAR